MYWMANRKLITEELINRGFIELEKDTYYREGIYISVHENGFSYLASGIMQLFVAYREMLGVNNNSIVLNNGRIALPA